MAKTNLKIDVNNCNQGKLRLRKKENYYNSTKNLKSKNSNFKQDVPKLIQL